MAAHLQYCNELRRKFGYHATWIPTDHINLGDYGIFEDNIFRRLGSIDDMQITFGIKKASAKGRILEHSSKNSIQISTKSSGSAKLNGSSLSKIDAGLIIDLKRKNSTFFKANDSVTHIISNITSVGKNILKLYDDRKWEKEWVVVTNLIHAKSASIFISSGSSGKIELKANGKVKTDQLDIANSKCKFTIVSEIGMDTKIIGQNLTPLFRIMTVKKRIFRAPVFRSNVHKISRQSSDKREHLYFEYLD